MNLIKLIALSIILILGLSACSTSYKGTLVDARNYLNLDAKGLTPAQQFSAFYAMKANLPAGIVMKNGKLILLCNDSDKLSKYASYIVKASGSYLPAQNLLRATQFWIKTEEGWRHVYIQ